MIARLCSTIRLLSPILSVVLTLGACTPPQMTREGPVREPPSKRVQKPSLDEAESAPLAIHKYGPYAAEVDLDLNQIALLLPFTGQFASAASAIRDGFIAAWYSDSGNPTRPVLTLYDANPVNIAAVYQQAIEDGADLVVGPLEKSAIEKLIQQSTLPVPVLALNQLETDTDPGHASNGGLKHDKLYQFGLPPEDEAYQVAERAWFDGHREALAITPASPWGDRIFTAFKQYWEALGGRIVKHQTYNSNTRDYSEMVKKLLNFPARGWTPRVKANPGQSDKSEPSQLNKADFVFMVAYPAQALQIKPQLELYRPMPIYSTSHIFYSGSIQPQVDQDLNGITFVDMPWVLDPGRQSPGLRDVIELNWPDNAKANLRLYAFGIDAYHLIPYLGHLQAQPSTRFEGETGSLRMDAYGRIHRQLTWAQFNSGVPMLLDNTESGHGR